MKGVLFACLTSLLWGVLAILLKVALGFIDATTIVWFRFTLAFLVLFLILLYKSPRELRIFKRPPLFIILGGLCLGFNYFFFMQGLGRIGASATQVVIQTGPLLLAVIGIFIFKEKVNRKQVIGFIIAATGLVVFYLNSITEIVNQAENFKHGFIWVLLAAMMWTIYAIFQKILVKKYQPQTLNVVLYLIPAIMFIPFVNYSAFANLTFGQWCLMVFLGLNTLVAYGSLAEAFKYTQAYKVSIIVTLNPTVTFIIMAVFALLEITWIQLELMTLAVWAGTVMMLGAAVYSIYASSKKVEAKN